MNADEYRCLAEARDRLFIDLVRIEGQIAKSFLPPSELEYQKSKAADFRQQLVELDRVLEQKENKIEAEKQDSTRRCVEQLAIEARQFFRMDGTAMDMGREYWETVFSAAKTFTTSIETLLEIYPVLRRVSDNPNKVTIDVTKLRSIWMPLLRLAVGITLDRLPDILELDELLAEDIETMLNS